MKQALLPTKQTYQLSAFLFYLNNVGINCQYMLDWDLEQDARERRQVWYEKPYTSSNLWVPSRAYLEQSFRESSVLASVLNTLPWYREGDKDMRT